MASTFEREKGDPSGLAAGFAERGFAMKWSRALALIGWTLVSIGVFVPIFSVDGKDWTLILPWSDVQPLAGPVALVLGLISLLLLLTNRLPRWYLAVASLLSLFLIGYDLGRFQERVRYDHCRGALARAESAAVWVRSENELLDRQVLHGDVPPGYLRTVKEGSAHAKSSLAALRPAPDLQVKWGLAVLFPGLILLLGATLMPPKPKANGTHTAMDDQHPRDEARPPSGEASPANRARKGPDLKDNRGTTADIVLERKAADGSGTR